MSEPTNADLTAANAAVDVLAGLVPVSVLVGVRTALARALSSQRAALAARLRERARQLKGIGLSTAAGELDREAARLEEGE